MTKLFDAHCHPDDEKFDGDRDDMFLRMAENGVTRCAAAGSDMASSRRVIALSEEHAWITAVAGVHPHEAKSYTDADAETLAGWYRAGKINAIGEIGLDYYYDLSPRKTQREVCIKQMALAWETGAPVVFHIRDAHADMLEIMKEMLPHLTPGVIHCFSGSREIAEEYLKLGYMISFAGPVTFKKAPKLAEAAIAVPDGQLLAETDSPYLAPEPVRGRRNEPANVRFVVMKLAELRGTDYEIMAELTFRNAERFYGLAARQDGQ